MSPLTLKKSRASKGSVSKVSLDRRRQERMCSGNALATPHFAQTGKTLLPWLKEQLLSVTEKDQDYCKRDALFLNSSRLYVDMLHLTLPSKVEHPPIVSGGNLESELLALVPYSSSVHSSKLQDPYLLNPTAAVQSSADNYY
ncbi:hypothetical protein AVEN_189166-1 [Araneus ventricosus]|uniref:Uncharacterized protein n=1 Tax=Araneus ventricosus TaxID=182803 RepID=A0A4Y2HNS4_ARAVE|nr:hypothetical protein AVEN_189166-1 [Araneus ventricosus]